MSLINKMLSDLEKRDAFLNENHDQVLDGLYSAYDVELKINKKSNTFLFIFVGFISVLIFSIYTISILEQNHFYGFYDNKNIEINEDSIIKSKKKKTAINKSNIITNLNLSVDIKAIKNKSYKSLKLDEQIVLKNIFEPSLNVKTNYIESIKFEMNDTGISLIMKMPSEIDYLVYGLTNPDRTVIEIENAELAFRLEDLVPIEPIVAIRYSMNKQKRFKLVLESNQPLKIKKSTTGQSGNAYDLVVVMEHQWQTEGTWSQEDTELVAIVEKQVEQEKNLIFKGDLIKTPITKSSNAYAEKLFQQAYIAYKQGKIPESLKKLNMSLDLDAGHVRARSTLALVLSEKDHLGLAYSVLNEGLIQYPENIEWIKMYARLLLKEGKPIEARAMLSKHRPKLASNTEYYALQGAVLQKLSAHEEAARIYRDLLHVNPLKGVWWMGLAISLESLKRYDDALYAYQKASSNSTLAKDTRLFLSQRINRLSNILADESS